VLYLSTKNRLIHSERLATGTIDRAAVYPRRVIEGAMAAHAAALVFCHNHPSGDPSPSDEDIILTHDLVQATRPLDIEVHDHIIIGNGRHYSFRREGLLKRKPVEATG
jgi:DNA repair protein RadC